MDEPLETTKDQGKKRREMIVLEVSDDIKARVALMAKANEMSVSGTVRLLITKALMSSVDDSVIPIRIPKEALLP
jgi:hypothetical protein